MMNVYLRSAILCVLLAAMMGIAARPAQALPPKYRITVIHKPGVNLTATALNKAGQVSGLICGEECFHTFLFDDGVVTDINSDLRIVNGRAMNRRGDIVGDWNDNADPGAFVFIDGNFQTLPAGDFVPFEAVDINSSRGVVGNGSFPGAFNSRAFIWERGVLSVIPQGPFTSLAASQINNAGQVAGEGALPNSEERAFLYEDGETFDLGTIPGAAAISANLLSGTGIVAGIAFMTDGTRHVVRSKDGAMIDLGSVGSNVGPPTAINNSGHLVGSMETAKGVRAFLHDGKSLRDLGALGGTLSGAGAITDNGQIVGGAFTAARKFVGFIYGLGTDTMYDLNSLVDSADPLKTKMRIQAAIDVNEFGQILAHGRDISIHRLRVMLLTPVDSTKPVVSSKLTGTRGTNAWFKSNVSLAWTVVDEEAPVGSKTGCGSAKVTTDTASQRFTCVAKSIGGTANKSVTVRRDATRPTVTIKRPAPGAIFSRNQAVTASFGCFDATAGIQGCVGTVANGDRIDTSQKVTNATFLVKATDKAGNTKDFTTTYSVQ
jgi:probable HAF family extracellular repeat protein